MVKSYMLPSVRLILIVIICKCVLAFLITCEEEYKRYRLMRRTDMRNTEHF